MKKSQQTKNKKTPVAKKSSDKRYNNVLLNMATGIEHVLYPPMPKGAAAILSSLIFQLEHSQWLPESEIMERQLKQFRRVVAYAEKFSPYYNNRFKEDKIKAEDIKTYDDIRKVPILARSDIQKAKEKLNCVKVPASHLPLGEVKTSGSTGQPVVVKKSAVNHLFWQANMMREHLWHKRDFAGSVVNIRGMIQEPTYQDNWGQPVSTLYKSGAVYGLPTTYSTAKHIEEIKRLKPNNLILYPNTLEAIVGLCEREDISIEGIDHVWCVGETLSPELRKRAAKLLKAGIEDDYSSNEVGIMALQCPDTGLYHIMSESVVLEVLDEKGKPCKPGEVGKVVVTNLHNLASPIIRYEIGDYAEVGEKCSCGRGLPTINSIKGRRRNLVMKPDGTRHWPPLTVAVFKSELPISQFQLIQHTLQDVEVKLVTERKFTKKDEEHLTGHFHKALGHPFKLTYVYFDERIPRPISGKFEDFMCKVI